MAASVSKTDQKKQKDRYSTNIFVETKWDKETELIMKFNEKCFLSMKFYHYVIMKNQVGKT